MKPKLLTKRQQIGIFNCVNPERVLREYVSFSPDVLFVAQMRLQMASLEKFIKRCHQGYPTETQKELFQNLSKNDAKEIFFRIRGHVYPEVFIKMLDTFPKEVSKELMLQYGEHCDFSKEVLIHAIGVLGKDAKEFIYTINYMDIGVFNKMYRVFGKDDTKKILMVLAGTEHRYGKFALSEDVELKVIRLYPKEDLRELLKCFIKNGVCLNGKLFCKIFDVCSSKEEIEELLDIALNNDMDIWFDTLDKIVEYFPKEEAKAYLDRFFENTSPGRCEYREEEKEEYYNNLLTDEEREALEGDDDDCS